MRALEAPVARRRTRYQLGAERLAAMRAGDFVAGVCGRGFAHPDDRSRTRSGRPFAFRPGARRSRLGSCGAARRVAPGGRRFPDGVSLRGKRAALWPSREARFPHSRDDAGCPPADLLRAVAFPWSEAAAPARPWPAPLPPGESGRPSAPGRRGLGLSRLRQRGAAGRADILVGSRVRSAVRAEHVEWNAAGRAALLVASDVGAAVRAGDAGGALLRLHCALPALPRRGQTPRAAAGPARAGFGRDARYRSRLAWDNRVR